MSLLALYIVACGLLILAGVTKLLRPANTAGGLRRLVPSLDAAATTRLVRSLASLEIVVGCSAVVWPNPPLAATVAFIYVAFAAFLLYVRARHGPLSTCGCLSAVDAPATKMHVVIDLLLGTAGAGVAASGAHRLIWDQLSREPLHGVPLLAASVCCGWLVVLTMSLLPRLADARLMVRAISSPRR